MKLFTCCCALFLRGAPLISLSALCALGWGAPAALAAPSVALTPATPTAYQPITLDLSTEQTLSEGGAVNPFLERRLQVEFTSPSGAVFDVPGFFAGDGSGATATSGTGDVFRVIFTPGEAGQWTYDVSFRIGASGSEIAVDLDPAAGSAGPGDGLSGSFAVSPPDPSAPGVLAKGKLLYTGEHYLRYLNGEPFVKGGADSPENWLGYTGFDNTFDGGAGPNTPDGLHAFPTHVADWNPGDPDWDRTDPPGNNSGRAIIGALNYLDSVGINSIYFLPMNIGGDGKDSWPYVGPIDPNGSPANDNTRFDISKLAQWDIFFAHAQSLGIHLHFVLNEAEAPNKRELDGYDANGNPIAPQLGVERKLFYREMIARFGYHNSIQWNVTEEYNLGLNLGAQTVLEFAAYIAAVDPYGTPTAVHNAGSPNPSGPLQFTIGEPDFDLTSIQGAGKADGWDDVVADWRQATADAGRKLAIMIDEPGSPTRDVADFDEFRKRIMWDIMLSGAGGEWFIHNRDQSLEDFREFDTIWRETFHIRSFIESNLPVTDMAPNESLVAGEASTFGGAVVLAQPGEVYALYFPDASATGSLDLSDAPGPFQLEWYNPRTGAFEGAAATLLGGAVVPLPAPPAETGEDWAALVRFTGVIDCNNNGIPDPDEIMMDPSLDCDNDGVLDECQPDCDDNGIADACEILADPSLDCDNNGVLDACQPDGDGDGVPDACEPDCNGNFIPDDAELDAAGGLAANFWPNTNLVGEPTLNRIDAVVDFQWGAGGPGGGVPGDAFSSRWSGVVRTLDAGEYEFSTTTNDGARLFIDGQLVIDEWQQQTATEFTATVTLPADTFVPIVFEHYQQGGTAVAELRWTPPGGAKTIIPESALRPALDGNNNGVPDACDPACGEDITGDGVVDVLDLNRLLAAFNQPASVDPPADITGDGVADVLDLNALLAVFNEPCP